MPLRFDIDHTARFVHAVADGDVVLADVQHYFHNLITQGAMPYPKLLDATRAVPRFSDDDVMELGAWASAHAIMEPRGPIAIVAVDPETTLLIRRYMNVGVGKRPIALFKTVAMARTWLDEQVGAAAPLAPSNA
ncbi:MAG: hypothetical protein KIT25_10330 [Enhydrobacter sp.]|nr:MAG: hypothetical protein KIT25_10330 [Enhydrobacter sp.]